MLPLLLGVAATAPWSVPQSRVCADQIVTGGRNYPGATIHSLIDGQLTFRGADGRSHTAWLGEVDLLIVDRGGAFVDFNQAEQFLASHEPQRAITRYRRTLKVANDFWPDLIAARLLRACDAAGQLDRAALNFVRVLRGRSTGPAAAARLMPRNIPEKRDARVTRALEHLEAALPKAHDNSQRVLLELLRFDILRRVGDGGALAAARSTAILTVPPTIGSKQVYAVQMEAMRRALESRAEAAALAGLDRAIHNCPDALVPGFLLLKGDALLRAALEHDEIVRAAWPFLRVVIHYPDDARAPKGLLGAASAMTRLGRPDKSARLLEECLAHELLDEPTRQRAQDALRNLRGAGGQAP